MNPVRARSKRLVRAVFAPLIRAADVDLRVVSWRLEDIGARHAVLSALLSQDDAPSAPSNRLIDLVAPLVEGSRRAALPLLLERNAPAYVHVWPGEHYRLLRAAIECLRPQLVIEIGTYTGLSALAMLPAMADGARLITNDIVPWDQIDGTYLRKEDFEGGHLAQLIGNLGDENIARQHADLLRQADFIFIDGPKDGAFERRLLANFSVIGLKRNALLLFDDIRVWNMLATWREISWPKLDFTSFGHWTGTGLVDWSSN
jgi:predicted O-methyltransferase YrrM